MPNIQTHTLNDSQHTTTTYTRTDLGIDTATITNTPNGHWTTRLYHGPEPDEYTSQTVQLESTADQLATQHSLTF